MVAFAIGGATHERVEVEILAYERAAVGDSDDDNWLSVQVSVSAGAFSASYPAMFRTEEIVQFRDQVEVLYQSLRGEAKFFTLDDQLSLQLTGNGRGGMIIARGIAVDLPGTGNRF